MPFVFSELIRIFLKNKVTVIPVVDQNQGGDIYLLGFLSKHKVWHYSVEKNRLEASFETIPDFFLVKEILPEHVYELFSSAPVPVYNLHAKFVEKWDKNQINFYLKNFLYSYRQPRELIIQDDSLQEKIKEEYEYLKLFTSHLPFPVMGMDVEYNCIFYNELFLKDIVDKGPFKKTLVLAQVYFKELLQNIIVEAITRHNQSDVFVKDWKELPYKIYISNILDNGEIRGYILVFLPLEKSTIQQKQQNSGILEAFHTLLNQGLSYEDIIENFEKEIIGYYLEKNRNNISHTAMNLKIKRTTLQNKLKRLGLLRTDEKNDMENNNNKKEETKKSSKKDKQKKNRKKG